MAAQGNIKVAAIDPGGHIGFALFTGEFLEMSGMFRNTNEGVKVLLDTIEQFRPTEIVIESFRLYPWKSQAQTWSNFETVEVIGVLKHWAYLNNYPVVMQPASCKQAFSDDRLKQMDMYVPNLHTRDAIRHGLYRQRFRREQNGVEAE